MTGPDKPLGPYGRLGTDGPVFRLPEKPPRAPETLFIAAAGLGRRMRPLTDDRPKPMVNLLNYPVIDWTLAQAEAFGIRNAAVNIHYRPDPLIRHLRSRRGRIQIQFSDERDGLLETGGGIRKALSLLGRRPFFAVNGDVVWIDRGEPALHNLARRFDATRMDALLLLVERHRATGFNGPGDFFMQDNGLLRRRGEAQTAPYVYTGIQILHPRLFAGRLPQGAFSLNLLYDRALKAQRLYGVRHTGDWYHIGTPDSLAEAGQRLREQMDNG